MKRRFALALGIAVIIAAAVIGALMIDRRDPPGLLLFIGRFHPLIVHFPIGLLVLAALLEVAAVLHVSWRMPDQAIAVVLGLGAASAVGAMTAGYLLSLEGGYDETLVTTHMWLGIAVTVGALAVTLLKVSALRRNSSSYDRAYRGSLIATLATVLLAGHQGGSLTHGPGYLTHYLPDPLKGLIGAAAAHAPRVTDIDSAYVYRDLIVPVLEARCISCHRASRTSGGLRLDTPEGLMEGGDDGAVIVAGDAEESELLRRITLSPTDEKAMPPDGARPLDVGETELIRWWIAHGASLEQRVSDIDEMPTSVATLLNRIAPPRPETKPAIYALEADPADGAAVTALKNAGFSIGPVAQDVSLLQVSAVNLRSDMGDDELRLLLSVATQITWLDLSHTRVSDAGLAMLAGMRNLTRLSLARTSVGDEAMNHLNGLENLEYLNLVGTNVSDAGLEQLQGLDRLKALYLWETEVSERGVELLKQSNSDLRVILGAAPVTM